jgi:hypothetical protein
LGGAENPSALSGHDWLMPGTGEAAWSQWHVRNGYITNGLWMVDVLRPGDYEITLYRWPGHLERAMECVKAQVAIAGQHREAMLSVADTQATIRVTLPAGPTELVTTLTREDGKEHGAYYASVSKMPQRQGGLEPVNG